MSKAPDLHIVHLHAPFGQFGHQPAQGEVGLCPIQQPPIRSDHQVDGGAHLTVAHEVVNGGNDRAQLAPMVRQAQAAIAAPEITVLADRGYMNGEQVRECEGTGILPCVPRRGYAIRSRDRA